MIVLRRPRRSFSFICETVLAFLLVGYQGLAFQPSLHRVQQQQQYKAKRILSHNGSKTKTTFGSSPTNHKRRRCTTKIALVGNEGAEFAASLWISSNEGPGLGGLILGLGFVASIGAFVFANVVYTPEILEGAEDMRRSERENEIAKILQAVRSHESSGKDLLELKVPLETALGKPLEDYVRTVLEAESNENQE